MNKTSNGPHILLAEDSPHLRIYLSRALERNGYRVTTARTGLEAVKMLCTADCDLVLMDISMPELDGLEATAAIRDSVVANINPHLPIIAMTAHTEENDRQRFLAAGMTGYVAKPVSLPDLLQELEIVLDRPRSKTLEHNYGLTCQDIAKLVDNMRQDLPGRAELLEKAAKDNDLAGVEKHAHYLAGSGLAMAAPLTSMAARRLEKYAAAGGGEELADMAARTVRLVREAMADANLGADQE